MSQTEELQLAPPIAGEPPMKQLAPFSMLEDKARTMIASAESIALLPPTEANARVARTMRLEIKPLRVAVEKRYAELKRPIIDAGNALTEGRDALLDLLKPMEAKLLAIEQHAEREALRIEDEKRVARHAEISPFLTGPLPVDLGKLPDDEYAKMLADAKDLAQLREERVRKEKEEAEAAKKKEEDEKKRIANENAKLKKEAAEREAEKERIDTLHKARFKEMEAFYKAPPFWMAQELGKMTAPEFFVLRENHQKLHTLKIEEEKAEADRAKAEREAAQAREMALQEIQGIRHQSIIAVAGRAGVRKGGTLECLEETLEETKQWPIDDHFGALMPAAQQAKDATIAEIEQALAIKRDDIARDKEESKKREAADAKLKADKAAADKKAEVDQKARKKAEDELAAKKAADAKAEADRKEAELKAANAPAKEKLMVFAHEVRLLALKTFSVNSIELVKEVADKTEAFAKWIEKRAESL